MADNSVRADTPDPSKYHPNNGGVPGVMLPRSDRDGRSLAFDPNKPHTVIVDPGEPGGGFHLDVSRLGSDSKFNAAARKVGNSGDVSQFYRDLSTRLDKESQMSPQPAAPAAAPAPAPAASAPAQVSAALAAPLQRLQELPPVPTAGSPATESSRGVEGSLQSLLEEEKVKAAREEQNVYDQVLRQARQEMSQHAEVINSLVSAVQAIQQSNAEPAAKPAAEPAPPATGAADAAEDVASRHSTGVAFLDRGHPGRPEFEAFFEMDPMGTISARYHAVVEGSCCLALVYDTRFEDGFQYLPPNLGETRIKVSVPKLDGKVYNCSSLGIHWTLGCLDVVILITHESDKEV